MGSKFPYLSEFRSMKKIHNFFSCPSMIDNIIPVSIALGSIQVVEGISFEVAEGALHCCR